MFNFGTGGVQFVIDIGRKEIDIDFKKIIMSNFGSQGEKRGLLFTKYDAMHWYWYWEKLVLVLDKLA